MVVFEFWCLIEYLVFVCGLVYVELGLSALGLGSCLFWMCYCLDCVFVWVGVNCLYCFRWYFGLLCLLLLLGLLFVFWDTVWVTDFGLLSLVCVWRFLCFIWVFVFGLVLLVVGVIRFECLLWLTCGFCFECTFTLVCVLWFRIEDFVVFIAWCFDAGLLVDLGGFVICVLCFVIYWFACFNAWLCVLILFFGVYCGVCLCV